MCFSAPASFIAGATLTAVGVATVRRAETKKEIPFAMIPLLFGLQQIVEGLIWLSFHNDAMVPKSALTFLYSGFSHVLWPVYMPFAVGLLEDVPWRKKTIFGFQVAGIAVGSFLLYYMIADPMVAEVIGKNIVYVSPHFYAVPVMILYLAATCISCLFSSRAFVRIFGLLAFVLFIAAYIIHSLAMISIWCFFAGILSLMIYGSMRFRKKALGSSAVQNRSYM